MQKLRWKIAQWFEKHWWKRYLQNKEIQEYLDWKKQYWNHFISNIGFRFSDFLNQKIYDLGCGPAGIFSVLTSYDITAIDPLLSSYEKLPHFEKSFYPTVHFIEQKIEDLALEKATIIFCLNALNHVENIHSSTEKIHALLEENGTAIISVDAHKHRFLKHLFNLFSYGDILHPHQYNSANYASLFKEKGFEITKSITLKQGIIFDYIVFILKKT